MAAQSLDCFMVAGARAFYGGANLVGTMASQYLPHKAPMLRTQRLTSHKISSIIDDFWAGRVLIGIIFDTYLFCFPRSPNDPNAPNAPNDSKFSTPLSVLILLRRLFFLAARQSLQAASALAPPRQFRFLSISAYLLHNISL